MIVGPFSRFLTAPQEAAGQRRLQARADQKYLAEKLERENAMVETAETRQAMLEEELTVCYFVHLVIMVLIMIVRPVLDCESRKVVYTHREPTQSCRY